MKPIEILKTEYLIRCGRNPKYSMRSFARDLGVSSGTLSELMNGKRPLTQKAQTKIASRLPLNLKQSRIMLQRERRNPKYDRVGDRQFKFISEWYNFAILNLVECKGVWRNSDQFADRLGISKVQARAAVDCLVGLGYLAKVDGVYRRIEQRLATTTDVPSSAIRHFHRQQIEKAGEALDSVPIELRDITAVTFAFDPSRMSEAKMLLQEFRRSFSQRMSSGEKNEVYALNMQLIPLTQSWE
jgi:uncharacterized protein (TIGR02147 family)